VLMPNIEGLSLAQARIILEENGLCEDAVTQTHDAVIRRDHIVTTSPVTGTSISRETCVKLLVSSGQLSEKYKMPDFTGMSLVDAILMLESSGLVPGKISSEFYDNRQWNSVIKHIPLPGHLVTRGTKIDLVINRNPGEKNGLSLPGLSGPSLFRYRAESGFLKKHIRIRLSWQDMHADLFNDFMEPGQEKWFLVPQYNDAAIFVYEDEKLVETKMFNP